MPGKLYLAFTNLLEHADRPRILTCRADFKLFPVDKLKTEDLCSGFTLFDILRCVDTAHRDQVATLFEKGSRKLLNGRKRGDGTSSDNAKGVGPLLRKLFRAHPRRPQARRKPQFVDKSLYSHSLLLHRVKQDALAVRCKTQGNARKTCTCANIEIISRRLTEILEYGKRVLKMQNYSILKGSDASKVENLVLLDHEVKVEEELVFHLFLEFQAQATEGRIQCGPFKIGLFHVKPLSISLKSS